MSSKKLGKKKTKITVEDQYKMLRKARRELDPPLPPAVVHKTDKKDQKRNNNVKEWDE